MQEMLELQADRIEATLHEYGVSGQVNAGLVLPQVIIFQIHAGPGQRVSGIAKLREELAMRLNVPGVLITRSDGAVCIEMPRPDRRVVTLRMMLARLSSAPPSQTALLGMSNRGQPLLVHFPSPNVAHLLVAGMTGSGKTELLRTILVTLALWGRRRDTVVYLVDPKGRGLAGLASLRSVIEVCDTEQVMSLLDRLLVEMDQRSSPCQNHVYLVIDELADLVLVERSVEVGLTRLLQRGREVGIHVVAATQRPSARVVAGLMRANFPVRITGAVNSASEAAIATGLPRSGAEHLLGKGDMVLAHQGALTRFQVALFGEVDMPLVDHLFDNGQGDKVVRAEGSPESLRDRLRDRLQLRSPGRPAKGFTEEMVSFAMGEIAASGACTQRALRNWHMEKYGTDINPPRAAAAIREAKKQAVPLALSGQGQGKAE